MKKSVICAVCGGVLLAGAAFCGIKIVQSVYTPRETVTETIPLRPERTAEVELELVEEAPSGLVPAEAEAEKPETTPEAVPASADEAYVSPVDFDQLQSLNPDIYAWLEIEGTDISYPIVQDPDDDTFYLRHNSDRAYSADGAIFSEATYNHRGLTDPVTVLYGHHMLSGAIFGNLQYYYSSGSYLSEHPTFTVYTPEAELTYGVFACVPFSSEHILYYNDFSDESAFETFFDGVFNVRELGAQFNETYAPQFGDKILILSTCLASNNTRRFLVMATLQA